MLKSRSAKTSQSDQYLRFSDILADFGHPQNQLSHFCHIAGTNGKGSTLAYLNALLRASGQSVNVYTSPHLRKVNERISLNGSSIHDAYLQHLDQKLESFSDLTYFERLTLCAFLAFKAHPADFNLVETGLGGRLDPTNHCKQPQITMISSISLDHQAVLGQTLAEIAVEKAGILRAGVPAVIGKQKAEVEPVLSKKVQELGAIPYIYGQNWQFALKNGLFTYESEKTKSIELAFESALKGSFQAENLALALAAYECLGFELSEERVQQAMKRASWPARFELMAEFSTPNREVWFDGAHNKDGWARLSEEVEHWKLSKADAKIGLVFNFRKQKMPNLADILAFFEIFKHKIDIFYVFEAESMGQDWYSHAELCHILPALRLEKTVSLTGLSDDDQAKTVTHLLVTGSLYLYDIVS